MDATKQSKRKNKDKFFLPLSLGKYGQASTSAPSAEELNPLGGIGKRGSSGIHPHSHGHTRGQEGIQRKGKKRDVTSTTSPIKRDAVYLNEK